jgi:hypothetical protein
MARSRVMRHLLAIVHEYDNEPEASGSDEATERDLEYFDRIIAILLAEHRRRRRASVAPGTGLAEYRVRWEIDLSAHSPLDAARRARRMQLRPDSLATEFEVLRHTRPVDDLDWHHADVIELTAPLRHDRIAESSR